MGRYSSDSEEEHRHSKKKKKRRSRSKSSDESYSRKSKKSKKKSRRRSRSKSSDKYSRRRSRSRDRRSRSRSYTRYRSKSRERRRSRSRSVSKHRSSRRSRSRSGSRSRRSSRSRRYSRSRSPEKDRHRRSRSKSETKYIKKEPKEDPCVNIPGFDSMSHGEQNELRMQMALKAAAATDERLRKEGVLPSSAGRAQAIADIDSDVFVQHSFRSNRAEVSSRTTDGTTAHENAMFSNVPLKLEDKKEKTIVYTDPNALMHPNLYESQEDKMERWIKKLSAMRRKKLEGEAMA